MDANLNIRRGRKLALFSFLGGTLILVVFILTMNPSLLLIGYCYLLIAFFINLIFWSVLLLNAYKDKINRKGLLISAFLMLINIPIAIGYMNVGFYFQNVLRVTFVNSTGAHITKVETEGCAHILVKDLAPNENETVWIPISGDCEIMLNYQLGTEDKKEQVQGYVTSMGGGKMRYEIGAGNKK